MTVQMQQIIVKYIPTKDIPVNVLAKPLPHAQYRMVMTMLGVYTTKHQEHYT